MRYWFCLCCKRKLQALKNEQILRCPCGTYEPHLLIETDKDCRPIDKNALNEHGWRE
jgi:hypothetical protein